LTTFVPGGIATEMSDESGLSKYFGGAGLFIQSPEACARSALSAFKRRKHTHVPGALNRATVLVAKVLPRRFLVGLVGAEYRKALALKNKNLGTPEVSSDQ
ncbi:MAG: hypothetical protein ACREJ3_05210, partial [Polyangiaceae bacterium]